MELSQTVAAFMDEQGVDYETLDHDRTATSGQTAKSSGVPRGCLAKGVLFCDEDDYVLAVVPASTRVDRRALCELTGERDLELASEDEIGIVFPDCEPGAVPATGLAFGLDTVVDEALFEEDDVYFEAGDHEHLVHVGGDGFRRLMAGVPHGQIASMS
jgi:Ala-tRNA(Pro) deacylase